MEQDRKQFIPLLVFLGIPVIWLGLIIAPYVDIGIIQSIPDIVNSMHHPLQIVFCAKSIRTVLILLIIYGLSAALFLSSQRKTRRKKEYGSASWGDVHKVNKKYSDPEFTKSKILSQNVRMSFETKQHRRNLNTLIIGGSGAGKTRFYGKPNIMQCNCSYVVLDPKGEILRDTGYLLEKEGYEIKVLDLIHMEKSHGYNPFHYIRNDNDILKLITNLIRNTTPKNTTNTADPFWEKSETALLQALFLYLYHEAPEDEQNFAMVMDMLDAADVKEDDEEYQSTLDKLFERLEDRKPGTFAYKQYRMARKGAAKTIKSILISAGVRLAPFNLDNLQRITYFDELELQTLGEKKTALFAIIPDNDSTFNFLVGMLYTQLFQMLYENADEVHGGELPIPVHFLMDEFANVALPDEFDKLLSTMRSRNIFVSIIIQNMAQLRVLYKDAWESIVGNCDELYYLGGNEQSTHKFISEYLGKETIDITTYGKSSGRSGNYSTNYQQTGRELMTPDEVRMIDNDKALLFIRGERPLIDNKFDLLKHPNIAMTKDGGMPAFKHGKVNHMIDDWYNIPLSDNEYELLSDEEMDDYFKKLEETK